MSWYVVSFDRRSDPGRDYDMIFLSKVLQKYKEAGEPSGFAVFERFLPGGHLHAYYFSPVSASYCQTLIDDHLGLDRGASCPEDSKFLLGDAGSARGESPHAPIERTTSVMDIKKTLDAKIRERERTLYFFLQVPPRATLPELLDLDHEIVALGHLVEQQRTDNNTRQSCC